jgi:ubiquinone/menaquinone biosynthesis C-methylase UbiE
MEGRMMEEQISRDEFGARQAEMSARWYENVQRTHGDVEAYIATRWEAYLDRWREAARFMRDGDEILDIGGGNIYPMLIDFLKEKNFRYNYLDVDPSCVDASRDQAHARGLTNSTFNHGYNDKLDYRDRQFAAIFSSHCIEHSIDLSKTFSELNRVLADNGNLLMAVPFGWEENPEHPYFFGPQEWVTLVIDAGFRIRVAQIGCEYPEYGYDYFIAAQKTHAGSVSRINPSDYLKTSFDFMPSKDERITYFGKTDQKHDHVITYGDRWSINIEVPADATEVLPVLNRHDWSGIVEVRWGDSVIIEDLYSWFAYVQPVRIRKDAPGIGNVVTITGRGRSPTSYSNQGVLYGVMYR